MASVTCTPEQANVGQAVTVEALDFLPSTLATMTVTSPHGNAGIFDSQAPTDASGEVASTDVANYAVTTLTVAGSTNPTAAQTITIGSRVYTWRTSVTTTADDVLIGANSAASLSNLAAAVNLTGAAGLYGSLTTVHATVRAGTLTATTLLLIAKTGGTAGNSLASTSTTTSWTFTSTVFASGAAATTTNPFRFAPSSPGIWVVTVTDGTTTVSANLTVFQGT